MIANGSGSVVSWEGDYLPYGGKKVISNADGLDVFYMFTGYEFDYEMGTAAGDYYANFRYDSSSLGRFFQPDPYDGSMSTGDPQSLNRYAYANNDPINLVDPFGLQSGKGCGGDPMPCGSPALLGGCPAGGDAGGFTIPCAAANPGGDCGLSIDGGGTGPCSLIFGGQSVSWAALASIPVSYTWAPSSLESRTGPDGTPIFTITTGYWRASDPDICGPTCMFLAHGASNFFAGAGDCITGRCIPFVHGSLTERARGDADSVVNKNGWSYFGGEVTGGVVLSELAAAGGATAAAARGGKYGAWFGRGGKALFNSGKVRFGWYWTGTRDAIGLRIFEGAKTIHIPFWHP